MDVKREADGDTPQPDSQSWREQEEYYYEEEGKEEEKLEQTPPPVRPNHIRHAFKGSQEQPSKGDEKRVLEEKLADMQKEV